MRPILISFLLVILPSAVFAGPLISQEAQSYARDRLSPAAAQRDLELARRNLENLHPGYDRYTTSSELTSQWQALNAKAEQGISRDELYLELARVLANIRCDHTKAEQPKAMEARRNVE